jgi:uncharacterized delta-60 repeat protein
VGSNLYNLKIRNQITSYSGITNLSGKFLSGTSNGFVLANISDITSTGSTSSPFTGGTVSGATIFTGGLSANTISATTYLNLPKDVFVSGGTYNSGTTEITFTNTTGGTFSVSGVTGKYIDSGTFYPFRLRGETQFTYNIGGSLSVTGYTYGTSTADGIENTPLYLSLDTSLGTDVKDIQVQSDGKILIGGKAYLTRLNPDGTEDTIFAGNLGLNFDNRVNSVRVQSDGKILVGGEFLNFDVNPIPYFIRLNSDGTEDTTFTGNLGGTFNQQVTVVKIQPDGKILVGGNFTVFNTYTVGYFVRLNSDGTSDFTFNGNLGSGFNSVVYSIELQPDGKILVGGGFSDFDGNTIHNLIRLNPDGTQDTAFNLNLGLGFDNNVYAIKLQPDNKILVGGAFGNFDPKIRRGLVRLYSDGTEDTSFYLNSGAFSAPVNNIQVQLDGKILVGGDFTTVNGVNCSKICRLLDTGVADSIFNNNTGLGFNGSVYVINIQTNGLIIVGGDFTSFNSIDRTNINYLYNYTQFSYDNPVGNDGSNSGRWRFITGYTSPTNPIGGNFITDSTIISSITKISISSFSIEGLNYYSWLNAVKTALQNSYSLQLLITEVGNNSIVGIFTLSNPTDNTTYFDFDVSTVLTSNGNLSNNKEYTISWSYGISGNNGTNGINGINAANSGKWLVSNATAFSDPSPQYFCTNNDNLDIYGNEYYSGITKLSISTTNYDYNDYYQWLNTLRSVVNSGNTVYLQMNDVSNQSYFGIYPVTKVTDNTVYFDVTLGTPIGSAGSIQPTSYGTVISWVFNGLNGSSGSGSYLPLSGGTVTGGTIFQSGVTANTISQTSYIDFTTGSTNPSQTGGRVFFDSTSKALSYYDIANNLVPIAMGQQLYTIVYNATGTQIDKGKVIAITGTSNSFPSAILAVNTHATKSAKPIGLAAENIPNGSEGLVLNNGILSGITLNTFANGDTLYLSDTVPGGYVSSTSSLAFTARTNEIGYVLQTGSTTGKIYVNINNEDSNLTLTDKERNILEGNVISGGVYEYTGMTQGTGNTINVALVRGWIVKNTYEYATLPDVTNVYYTGGTNIPITNLATADATFILINSASTLVQQTTYPTPQERREKIFLGKVVHPTRTSITSLNQTVDFDVSPMAALRDLWTPLKLINQGVIVSYYSAGTMSIQTSAGTLWGNGIGWTTNQQNPDSISISGTSPTTFQYRSRFGPITGSTGLPAAPTGNTTTIDSHHYDLNGSIVAVGANNRATNQRIYLFPTGLIRIQYGQFSYSSMANAIAGIDSEIFVEYGNNRDNGILIGILTVREDASDLSLTTDAQFRFVSKFGELLAGAGGISTTTLQQAYDNSVAPEILTNSTLGALHIKNGTGNADNVSTIFETINASGTSTAFMRADGAISGTSIYGTGLTATTISATTYYNLPTDIRTTGGTYSNNTFTFTNNTGGTYSVFFNTLTGLTVNGGLTITGNTSAQGLTATTISATTYQNLPSFNYVRITGTTQFSAGTNNYLNFSGVNITITSGSNNTLIFSAGTGGSGGVTSLTASDGISGNTTTGAVSIVNTDKGSSQNIFKNIKINGTTQFSAGSNSSDLNFSGVNITITSAATNTLLFSASTSSSSFTGGTVAGATTFTNGLSANTISATTITGNTIFSGSSDISTLFTPLSNYRASGATFSSFTGTPLSLQVTFSSNFADTNYAVIITGQDERSFYITNKLVSGFTINTGSNTALTGNVDWIAFRYR